MADQVFPPLATRSDAKKVADDVNFTLALLLMSKRLLFSGFYSSVESFNELLDTAVKLMKKPTAGTVGANKKKLRRNNTHIYSTQLPGEIASNVGNIGRGVMGKIMGRGKEVLGSGIQMMNHPEAYSESSRNMGAQLQAQRHEEANDLITGYRGGRSEEEVARKIGTDLYQHLKR
jgi:hypothetical protein